MAEQEKRDETFLLDITKGEFVSLINARRQLEELQALGVDNWGGYNLSEVDYYTVEKLEEDLSSVDETEDEVVDDLRTLEALYEVGLTDTELYDKALELKEDLAEERETQGKYEITSTTEETE